VGKELRPRELLDIYLHGKYFHSDPDKAELIRQLEQGPDRVARVMAIDAAVAVAHTASWLVELIQR
jgi:hypothetical protein